MTRAVVAVMTAINFMATLTVCAGGAGGGGSLQGAEWVVEDIAGAGVIDRSRATVNFGADGRIFGRASCNNYTGEYVLTGAELAVSRLAATEKACAPALMEQERRFLDILQQARRFTLTPEGALILYAEDDRTLTARR